MTLSAPLCSSAALALCLTAAASAETLLVTSFEATGPGTMQAALDAAGASDARSVIMVTEEGGTITTETGLLYEGTSAVVIIGNGVTITSPNDVTLLTANGPQTLAIIATQFTGPGGFSLTDGRGVQQPGGDTEADAAQDTAQDTPAGKGILFTVPPQADDIVTLVLTNVAVSGVAGHGVHMSDCTDAAACTDAGSNASLILELNRVAIFDVGHGAHDADGLRVDERGIGSIDLTGITLEFAGVGADGVELDEGGEGDVIVDLSRANFLDNGSYCNPGTLRDFMPTPAEGTFDAGVTQPADLPQPSPDTPDIACLELEVETHDDGSVASYVYSIDVDDGFDIDEAGPGSVIASLSIGQTLGNFDEGYDFDEAGPGDIDVVFTGIIANGNLDDAIKLSESGAGSVFMTSTAVEASSNVGVGIAAEEEDNGNLSMVLISSATAGNDGGALGVEAVQDGAGEGNVFVIDSEFADGIDTHGVTLDAD